MHEDASGAGVGCESLLECWVSRRMKTEKCEGRRTVHRSIRADEAVRRGVGEALLCQA